MRNLSRNQPHDRHHPLRRLLPSQALEALGVAIQPYLCEGAAGKYALCREVDSSGPLFEMVVEGQDKQGRPMQVELMVPIGMIRMVVSVKDHLDAFGFGVG